MSYLDRLKQKIGEQAGSGVPAKPAEAPFAAFAGTPGRGSAPNFVPSAAATPSLSAQVDNDSADHWLILRPLEKLERRFTPPVARTELESLYPEAALIPIQPSPPSSPTEDQKAELERLVRLVATASGFTEAEHAEALGSALRDPESALVSFRALAAELGITEERSAGSGSVRLWLTMDTAEGPQRISLDIPRGKFDRVALLEMFEKHREAGTTRMLKV